MNKEKRLKEAEEMERIWNRVDVFKQGYLAGVMQAMVAMEAAKKQKPVA